VRKEFSRIAIAKKLVNSDEFKV